jgi:hypothetical protein
VPKNQALITPRLAGSSVPRVTHCNASNTFNESSVGLAEFEVDYDVPAFATGVTTDNVLATLLPDSKVPVGHKVVITDFQIFFPGPTTWTNFGSMTIRDSADSPTPFFSWTPALTAAAQFFTKQIGAVTNFTVGSSFLALSGGATGRGLQLYLSGGTNPNAGSAFKVHLKGYFKKV